MAGDCVSQMLAHPVEACHCLYGAALIRVRRLGQGPIARIDECLCVLKVVQQPLKLVHHRSVLLSQSARAPTRGGRGGHGQEYEAVGRSALDGSAMGQKSGAHALAEDWPPTGTTLKANAHQRASP
jgi:hypothetical protein